MENHRGFTLIEMMLVLVIAAVILSMLIGYSQQKTESLQIDRTAMQMESVLNAGMAYYVNHSQWPTEVATLQTENYLPAGVLRSPWGEDYRVVPPDNPNAGTFSVSTMMPTTGLAQVVAGRVPLGAVNDTTVTATISLPGQNLNNARSVNFSAVYRSGACVPAPQCPAGMSPQIFVAPASVSGLKLTHPSCANPSNPDECTYPVIPIHGFRAFAIANQGGKPFDVSKENIPNCDSRLQSGLPSEQPCYRNMSLNGGGQPVYSDQINNGLYWRICLQVVTEQGVIQPFLSGGGGVDVGKLGLNMGSIVAITRCTPNNEPSGSSYNVWSY